MKPDCLSVFNPGPGRRWWGWAWAGGVTMLALSGCTGMHWERSFYEGFRVTAKQCPLTRKPGDAPCAEVPAYDPYERERVRAKSLGGRGPSNRLGPDREPPVDEVQL